MREIEMDWDIRSGYVPLIVGRVERGAELHPERDVVDTEVEQIVTVTGGTVGERVAELNGDLDIDMDGW